MATANAAKYAIIGMTSGLLREQFRYDRFSGPTGAAELRADPELCTLALKLSGRYSQGARQESVELNIDIPRNLMDEGQRSSGFVSREGFLSAVERGLEQSGGERCWVLDATMGKEYSTSLALLDANGEALLAVVGSPPGETPPIVASVRAGPLQWWDASGEMPVECGAPAPTWPGAEAPRWYETLFPSA